MRPQRDAPPPRYRPDISLPPYTYIPGRGVPHPLSDVAGHSHGRTPHVVAPIDEENWSTHSEYLHAVDLFNHGYYWESHEAWEALWIAAGRRGPIADFLKGLIKLAAAGVKVREGRPAGVTAHAHRAAELFFSLGDGDDDWLLGLRLNELAAQAAVLAGQPPQLDAEPSDVRPLHGLRLVLRLE